MPNYEIWMLEESEITVGGGQQLDGITQGDGSHLLGVTIRLDSNDWLELRIRDGGDTDFDDNDDNQRLRGSQDINGTNYGNNTVIEAEYTIVLQDPDTLEEYTAVAVNVVDSSPTYATVEGLSFVGGQGEFPPIGKDLVVIETREGPGSLGQPAIDADDYAFPVCFTPGAMIATARGRRPVEALRVGDLVRTRDRGFRPVQWLGRTRIDAQRLSRGFVPVRIAAGALGCGLPAQDLVVSQQHRILLTGWLAELLFGEPEVFAAAVHLIDGRGIRLAPPAGGVTYLHLMFDRHEVIYANGLAVESFFPGPQSLSALDRPARAELLALFPELAATAPAFANTARTALKHWESSLLTA